MGTTFRELLGQQVLVADGGLGTALLAARPTAIARAGHPGRPAWLVRTRPDLVAATHDAFLAAGCDMVTTATCGLLPGEDQPGVARDLARRAACLARRCADRFAVPGHPRFVAGSVGPGRRWPSRGEVDEAVLRAAYRPVIEGLVAGGCDLLLLETCRDPRQARAALAACRDVLAVAGRDMPLGVQFCPGPAGDLPGGISWREAVGLLPPPAPAFLGLNCGHGPDALLAAAARLAAAGPLPLSVQPSAGLPVAVDARGTPVYDLAVNHLVEVLERCVREHGAVLVGGCCGVTPEQMDAVVARLGGRPLPLPP